MAGPYAGLVTRGLAFLADVLIINTICLAITAGIGFVVSAVSPGDDTLALPEVLATAAGWLAFGALYLVAFWVLAGQTPGMRLMGIHVTGSAGGRVTLRCGVRRLVGLAMSFLSLGIGFLMMLFDDRRRALQDRVGGTVVVRAGSV
jgi:uncharacterized RDD family membrane protein YckC